MRSIPTAVNNSDLRHSTRALAAVVIAIVGAVCCGGCQTARTGVEVIDLDYRRINDDEKMIRHVDVGKGYWWTEGDRLIVALTTDTKGLTPLDHKRFDLTLALDGMPAEKSRTYELGREAVRGYLRYGLSHERFRSMLGIANVQFGSGNRLRGKFRLSAAKEFFHVLTDWAPAGPVVLVGEFSAVKNQRAGGEVLARSDEDGMGRTPLTYQAGHVDQPDAAGVSNTAQPGRNKPADARPTRGRPSHRVQPQPMRDTRPKPVRVVGPELTMEPAS